MITAPLTAEVTRLKQKALESRRLEADLLLARAKLHALAADAPEREVAVDEFLRLGELAMPHLLVSGLPTINQCDALGSTLVADGSGRSLTAAISGLSETDFLQQVVGGSATTRGRDLSLLLAMPPEVAIKLGSGSLLYGWNPVVLPLFSGTFACPQHTPAEAEKKWTAVVDRLLEIRRAPTRYLHVTPAGESVLNSIKTYAEQAASRIRQTEWIPSPVTLCTKLAGILHILHGGTGDPSPGVWADAKTLTEWLVETQICCMNYFLPKPRGLKPRVHPPTPEDRERMRRLIGKGKAVTYRELVRYLPKRQRGYWKTHFHVLAATAPRLPTGQVSENGATGPTCPATPTWPACSTPFFPSEEDGSNSGS